MSEFGILLASILWHTFLKGLQTFECNLKEIGIAKLGGVVQHVDAEEGYHRHLDGLSFQSLRFLLIGKRSWSQRMTEVVSVNWLSLNVVVDGSGMRITENSEIDCWWTR
jgi:hypothetical protein